MHGCPTGVHPPHTVVVAVFVSVTVNVGSVVVVVTVTFGFRFKHPHADVNSAAAKLASATGTPATLRPSKRIAVGCLFTLGAMQFGSMDVVVTGTVSVVVGFSVCVTVVARGILRYELQNDVAGVPRAGILFKTTVSALQFTARAMSFSGSGLAVTTSLYKPANTERTKRILVFEVFMLSVV